MGWPTRRMTIPTCKSNGVGVMGVSTFLSRDFGVGLEILSQQQLEESIFHENVVNATRMILQLRCLVELWKSKNSNTLNLVLPMKATGDTVTW